MDLPSLLAPSALWALALLGPLALLYLLRLKRRELPVSSTLLWRRAFEEYRVNHPFQRWRWRLLFVLQALALALLAVAAARAVLPGEELAARRVILLLDRSASMQTREADGRTRFAQARDWARETLAALDDHDEAMLVAFDREAQLVVSWTSDRDELARALDALAPTDQGTDVSGALALITGLLRSGDQPVSDPQAAGREQSPAPTDARGAGVPPAASPVRPESVEGQTGTSFDSAPSAGSEAALRTNVRPGARGVDLGDLAIFLFSDGRGGALPADDLALPVTYCPVGEAQVQAGLSAFDVRRDFPGGAGPGRVQATAVVERFAPEDSRGPPLVRRLHLEIDGRRARTADLRLAPGVPHVECFDLGPLEAGVLRAWLEGDDPYAPDDAAWAVLCARPAPGLVFVGVPHRRVERVLTAGPAAPRLRRATLAEFDADPEGVARAGDLVVFHRARPARLPPGRYLFLQSVPPLPGFAAGPPVDTPTLLPFPDETHPLLRYLSDYRRLAAIARAAPPALPPEARVVIEAREGPILSTSRRGGVLLAQLALDVDDSLWPIENSFVVLFANLLAWFEQDAALAAQSSVVPGAALSWPWPLPEGPLALRVRPAHGGAPRTETLDAAAAARGVPTAQAGLYELLADGAPVQRAAVNALERAESQIAPVRELRFADGAALPHRARPDRVFRDLWPWLAAAALGLILVEWHVYQRGPRSGNRL